MVNETTSAERRRSERILQELLVKVTWNTSKGKEITVNTRTVDVSRYGARVLLKNALDSGQEITVYCLITEKAGKARIVGTFSKEPRGIPCGIEFLDQENNLWNIPFRLLFDAD